MRSGISRRTSRPYRKYRPLPALLLVLVLGGFSAFIWLKVLEDASDVDDAVRCLPPASPPPGTTFTPVAHDSLDGVDPIPPDKVSVRVLNASGARGQAAITTEALRQFGFDQVREPANDPAYEKRTAGCRGQIRYGENGESAARTLSLVESCLELVKDNRKDASVDLAIGSDFGDVRPRSAAVTVFEQLNEWSKKHAGSGKSELSENGDGPEIDRKLLESARSTSC